MFIGYGLDEPALIPGKSGISFFHLEPTPFSYIVIIRGHFFGDIAAGGKSCSLSSINLFVSALFYDAPVSQNIGQ
jgi:hypothetical protein